MTRYVAVWEFQLYNMYTKRRFVNQTKTKAKQIFFPVKERKFKAYTSNFHLYVFQKAWVRYTPNSELLYFQDNADSSGEEMRSYPAESSL